MKKIILFLSLCLTAANVYAGSIQLSTYYPSPFGYYERLKFNPRTSLPETCEPGTVYYLAGTGLRYCAEDTLWKSMGGGVWTQSGDLIYPADTATNPNLNIGIGTTGPSAKLEILTTAAADPVFKMGSTGVSDYQSLMLYNGSGNTSLFVAGTANDFIPGTTAGDGGYRVAVGKNMFFGNTGAAFMTLLPSGKIGIGTTSPLGGIGLHLKTPQWSYSPAAGMIIQAAAAGDSPGLMLFGSNNYEKGALGVASLVQNWSYDALVGDVVLRSSNGRLIFSTESLAASPPYPAPPNFRARMLIDQSGNVGIGTTNPGVRRLHVSTSGDANALVVEDSSGNVGIGTDVPYSALDIVGHVTWGPSPALLTGHLSYDTSAAPPKAVVGSMDSLIFRAGGSDSTSDRMIIEPTGNVGIGTMNPEATLQLNGTAKIFGSWVTRVDNTVYQAPTDGFVVAVSGSNGSIYGYTDSNTPPTTMMARNGGNAIPAGSITFPVRKNDYWMTSGASDVYWLPLGN